MQDESSDDQNSARDKGQGAELSHVEGAREDEVSCRHGDRAHSLEPWPASLLNIIRA